MTLNRFESRSFVESRPAWDEAHQTLELLLSSDLHNSGISSLVRHRHVAAASTRTVSVRTTTLDAAFAEQRLARCHFCKIDVERAECQVVRGFRDTLKARLVDYLFVEMMAGSEAQEELHSHDYRGWFVSERDRRLVPIGSIENDTFGDFVFVRPQLIESFGRRMGILV